MIIKQIYLPTKRVTARTVLSELTARGIPFVESSDGIKAGCRISAPYSDSDENCAYIVNGRKLARVKVYYDFGKRASKRQNDKERAVITSIFVSAYDKIISTDARGDENIEWFCVPLLYKLNARGCYRPAFRKRILAECGTARYYFLKKTNQCA